MSDAAEAISADAGSTSRRAAFRGLAVRALKLFATAGALSYLLFTVDLTALLSALGQVPWVALLTTCVCYFAALALGAWRWRLLMQMLEAAHPQSFAYLFRMYLVGLFYNTFVPGGVGGDLIRGLATREAFGAQRATASLSVVVIERAMGLGGMFLVVATATMVFPLAGVPQLAYLGALGMLAALGGFVALFCVHRIALFMPRWLQVRLLALPVVTNYRPLPWAMWTAPTTHCLVSVGAYAIIVHLAPQVTLAEALTLVPLSLAMAYLPISLGGVGVVELSLVGLLSLVGVEEAPALSIALALRACQWAVALPGGALSVLYSDRPTSESLAASASEDR